MSKGLSRRLVSCRTASLEVKIQPLSLYQDIIRDYPHQNIGHFPTSLLGHTEDHSVEAERSQLNAQYGSGPEFAKGNPWLHPGPGHSTESSEVRYRSKQTFVQSAAEGGSEPEVAIEICFERYFPANNRFEPRGRKALKSAMSLVRRRYRNARSPNSVTQGGTVLLSPSHYVVHGQTKYLDIVLVIGPVAESDCSPVRLRA